MIEKQILSLVNISDSSFELDFEARQALNLINTGKMIVFLLLHSITNDQIVSFECNLVLNVHANLFSYCHQPVKEAIVRLFPFVCVFR